MSTENVEQCTFKTQKKNTSTQYTYKISQKCFIMFSMIQSFKRLLNKHD